MSLILIFLEGGAMLYYWVMWDMQGIVGGMDLLSLNVSRYEHTSHIEEFHIDSL